MRERILAPLGMTSTVMTLTPALQERAAEGHSAEGDVVPMWDIPTLAGAGALRSSLHDMMLFLAANLRPAESPLGRAMANSHQRRFRVSSGLSLGLNWHITVFRGDTLVWHNGGTAGVRTLLAWNPATWTGAVLLGSSSQDNEDIVRAVLLGTPLTRQIAREEITLSPAALQPYLGTWEFSPQFAIRVFLEDGVLHAQPTDQPKVRLYAEAVDRFFFKVVEAQLLFERNAAGAVEGVTLVQGGARLAGRRK